MEKTQMMQNVNNTSADKKQNSLDKKWDIILAILCLGFYLFFPFYDGPVWCVDSTSYATMNVTREPLYPIFLAFFRWIFGEGTYDVGVVMMQSLIAACATYLSGIAIAEFGRSKKSQILLGFTGVFSQFAVTLLCRFVANRGSSYIDCIMTEGLGLSLFVLFLIALYKCFVTAKKTDLLKACILALLLVCLRKQMLLVLCLMAAMVIYRFILDRVVSRPGATQNRSELERMILVLFSVVLILGASKVIDRTYNLVVRNMWIEHCGNSMGALCTFIYCAEEEDAMLFEDDVQRALFQDIYAQAKEQHLLFEDAQSTEWMTLTSHYADSYDAIGYGIINPVVQGYIISTGVTDEVPMMLAFDIRCNDMLKTLMRQDKNKLVQVMGWNIWKGMVNSIARVHPLLNIYALMAYITYIALYIALFVRYKKLVRQAGYMTLESEAWEKQNPQEMEHRKQLEEEVRRIRRAMILAEVVLGAVLINSGVVGVTIFTQPRYMIYGMGMFYAAFAVLIYEFVTGMRKTK